MSKSRSIASMALALLLAATTAAVAQEEGDPEAGAQKAGQCAACHGPDGNSNNPEWPKLAGQHEDYLLNQLRHFKDGTRENAVMAGQVAGLSEQDMRDLAAYYATQTMSVGEANEDLAEQGERIYRGGLPDKGIPACTGCHGPAGLGNPPAGYPRISGQQAVYLVNQLRAYRDGGRAGYPQAEIMAGVAEGLSGEEIEAVSSFLSGLYVDD